MHAATGEPTIADDSGIAASALGGRPGVHSARFAGPDATDEQNLDLLISQLAREEDRAVAYVCVLAYIDAAGAERLFEGRCEGTLITEPRGSGGFGYDPAFVPLDTGPGDERTMAELEPDEKHAISHRGRAARKLAAALGRGRVGHRMIQTKAGAAGLSIISNATLIVLKLAAGAVTGSIAIITEAIHSAIDLLASVVALFSVRAADEPADREHPYGHEKVENLAAAIEGMLILVGAGIIIYEATRRLVIGAEIEDLGIGIAVIAFSALANLAVSTFLYRRARALDSPALEGDAAHLRTDALTSAGVLVGLLLVEITGDPAFDSIAALAVAVAIVIAGVRILTRSGRVLVDEAPPPAELDLIEAVIADERRAHPGDRRLPQAPRPPRRGPPLHRPPPAVRRRDHARGRARGRPLGPRGDRARAPELRRPDPQRARAARCPRPRRTARGAVQSRLIAAAAPTAVTTIE